MSAQHTPGPWEASWEAPRWVIQHDGEIGKRAIAVTGGFYCDNEANARLIATSPETLSALEAASGYLMNAKIDLETGCTKATAIATIEGGLKLVRAAIAKARGQ
jgi:hypothetical protein